MKEPTSETTFCNALTLLRFRLSRVSNFSIRADTSSPALCNQWRMNQRWFVAVDFVSTVGVVRLIGVCLSKFVRDHDHDSDHPLTSILNHSLFFTFSPFHRRETICLLTVLLFSSCTTIHRRTMTMTLKSSHNSSGNRLATGLVATTFLLSYVTGFTPSTCTTASSFGVLSSSLFSSTTANIGTAPILKSILRKPSKVLTVGVELAPTTTENSSWGDRKNELSILSMQLRKSKVSSIWVSPSQSLSPSSAASILETIVEEQKTAQGNFPGPVPVIYDASAIHDSDVSFAAMARIGVSAVAVTAKQADNLQEDDLRQGEKMMEIIWKVSSVKDIEDVMKRTCDAADAFLLDIATSGSTFDSLKDVAEALPSTCLRILSVDAMQPDGKEVEDAKKSKVELGCTSILVRKACVGDQEDLEYTQFVVGGMTSKASSEFKFSGLTGSTNGHFGGIQQNQKINWRRKQS